VPAVLVTAAVRVDAERSVLLSRARGWMDRPERLDEYCLAGVSAAKEAIDRAHLPIERLREARHALVLGSALGSLESDYQFQRQTMDLGLALASPRLFATTLPNLVLGEIAIALRLRGDNWMFSAGRASGLVAIGEAASAVATGELDAAVVLALDVVGPAVERLFGALGTRPEPCAAALMLENEAFALGRDATVLAAISDYKSRFDAAREPEPAVDPLGCAGIADLLAAVADANVRPRRIEVRCPTGYSARVTLGPGGSGRTADAFGTR